MGGNIVCYLRIYCLDGVYVFKCICMYLKKSYIYILNVYALAYSASMVATLVQ